MNTTHRATMDARQDAEDASAALLQTFREAAAAGDLTEEEILGYADRLSTHQHRVASLAQLRGVIDGLGREAATAARVESKEKMRAIAQAKALDRGIEVAESDLKAKRQERSALRSLPGGAE